MTNGPGILRRVAVLRIGMVVTLALTAIPGTAQTRSTSPILRRDSIARVARERAASIVFLHTMTVASPGQQPLEGLSTPPQQPPNVVLPIREGLGSGVVIDASGLICQGSCARGD